MDAILCSASPHLGSLGCNLPGKGLAEVTGIPSWGGSPPRGRKEEKGVRGGKAEPLVAAQMPLHDLCVSQEHRQQGGRTRLG